MSDKDWRDSPDGGLGVGYLGRHTGRHEASPACDRDPVCPPWIEGTERPMVKCHCGEFTWPQGAQRGNGILAAAANHSVTSCSSAHRPEHYDGGYGLDGWAIIDAFGLDFYLGNVVKYVIRAGKKDYTPRLDDLRKARNYINKAIELEEEANAD